MKLRRGVIILFVVSAWVLTFVGWMLVRPKVLCQQEVAGISVRVVEEAGLMEAISPHLNRIKTLIIGGKSFRYVRGGDCPFQVLPELKSVFFVTSERDNTVFHLFDLQKNFEKSVPSGDATGFGYTLGLTSNAVDFVSIRNPDKLVLRQEGFDTTLEYEWNVTNGALLLTSEIRKGKQGISDAKNHR